MNRPLLGLLAAALLALALSACGSEPERTPSACLVDEDAYLQALQGAPAEAELAPGVPISSCLVPAQPVGDLNQIGTATVAAATELNAAAQKDPGGESATELGYLVGSLEAGAADTSGIHTDLIRRINSAARFSSGEQLGAEFERTYGAGYAAARQGG